RGELQGRGHDRALPERRGGQADLAPEGPDHTSRLAGEFDPRSPPEAEAPVDLLQRLRAQSLGDLRAADVRGNLEDSRRCEKPVGLGVVNPMPADLPDAVLAVE